FASPSAFSAACCSARARSNAFFSSPDIGRELLSGCIALADAVADVAVASAGSATGVSAVAGAAAGGGAAAATTPGACDAGVSADTAAAAAVGEASGVLLAAFFAGAGLPFESFESSAFSGFAADELGLGLLKLGRCGVNAGASGFTVLSWGIGGRNCSGVRGSVEVTPTELRCRIC